MKKITQLFGLFALCFLMVSSVNAQKVTVDEIVETYLENIGGAEKWKTVKSIKFTGKSAMQGMEFPVTRYGIAPNKMRMDIDIMGKTLVQAYDGETAWMINPMQGSDKAQKMDEETTKEFAKEEFEDPFIDYKEKGNTVTLEGTEEIDGTETYKLKMVKKDGNESFYFFDKDDMVPIMIRNISNAGPMKGQAVDTYVSDYQEVDGLFTAFTMKQTVGGQTVMEISTEKIEFNVELEDSFFSMPAEVEAVPAEKN